MQPFTLTQTTGGSVPQCAENAPTSPATTKAGTRKRALVALACPTAMVAVSACHVLVAATYCIALMVPGKWLYVPLMVAYSVVSSISLFKVYETYRKRDDSIVKTDVTQAE